MFSRPMLRCSAILAAATFTLALGACSDAPTYPASTARHGLAIGDPPSDTGTTLPPPPPTTVPTPPPTVPAPTPAPSTPPLPGLVAVFVIGDAQAHGVGSSVNFWGANWSKHNQMTGVVSNGAASFKGYASQADLNCGGSWSSRSGASVAPATIGSTIAVIVTSKLVKQGADVSGDIKEIVLVAQDGGYSGNPGHAGNGVVTGVVCSR
jgi:hypothetical protein